MIGLIALSKSSLTSIDYYLMQLKCMKRTQLSSGFAFQLLLSYNHCTLFKIMSESHLRYFFKHACVILRAGLGEYSVVFPRKAVTELEKRSTNCGCICKIYPTYTNY